MNAIEVVIWSSMLGGLLTLATVALADALINRSMPSLRGLLFLALTGTSSVLMSGLPEHVFPQLSPSAVLLLQCSLGPLSGALILTNLGLWLGVAAEDRWVNHTIVWGSGTLIALGIVMAIATLRHGVDRTDELIAITAAITSLSVALALFASLRAAQLGDVLARWMALACLLLAISVAGLFADKLYMDTLGPVLMALVAFCTVAYFLVVVALGIVRNRMQRKLERLAGLAQGVDPATGLPVGSVLLSKVDDAFWRSIRSDSECAVICLHLRNLYELGEVAGHTADQQILSAMAARVRRSVGFRCVVGLYHPRCFVVVASSVKQRRIVKHMIDRLQFMMRKPLNVVSVDGGNYVFMPRFSIGSVIVSANAADPSTVIDEAERNALGSEKLAADDVTTADSLTSTSL
jgi:GGDEF domain-containing protein